MGIESPNTAGGAHRPWTKLAVATLALVVISAIGLIGWLVVRGDPTAEQLSTSEEVFGAWMELSWLLCLVVGPFAWIRGRMKAQSRTAMAGRRAVAYVVLAFVVVVIAVYGQGTR